MPIQPSLVKFAGVDKRYGAGPLILDSLSFEVNRGDFISLIGPSGCGKSTVLKLISGLNPVTSGTIVVDGMEPRNAVEELAFVFQEPTLLPWLTVAENVEIPMKLHKVSKPKRAKLAADASPWSGFRTAPTIIPASSPADRRCASPLRAPCRSRPTSCCWMNPSGPWTR